MAFLDEDELRPASDGPGAHRPGFDRQRQVMVRRVFALGVGVLVIILVLLGIKGCLNERKQRGFENYVSDLGAIATQSNQLSNDFFTLLEDPPKGQDEQALEAQIATDRGSAENLLQRTEGLSTPDELSDPQVELVEAFTLRRDALAGIAADIQTALGGEGRGEAIDRLTQDMRALLASDVLYVRARDNVQRVLADEDVDVDPLPESQFLPDPIDRWIDDIQLTTVLSSFATDAGTTSGIHGVALLSAAINGTDLTADAENSVEVGSDAPALEAEVQNQGDQEESDVTVKYTLSGGAVPIEGEGQIAKLDAQGIDTVKLPFEAGPETGVALTLEVQVVPVLGEEVADNNSFTYTVTFN